LVSNGYNSKPCDNSSQNRIWDEVYNSNSCDYELRLLKWEWRQIVQDYLKLSRIGSGKALNRKERNKVWAIFELYRNSLDKNGLVEYDDIIRQAHVLLLEQQAVLAYDHIIVDEAQDFSENTFHLISQLAHKGSLFITDDSQQRIYGRKIILSHCGIEVLGRRRILKLNYRTTDEIGKLATGILSGKTFDNLDGDNLDTMPYKSIIHGEYPVFLEGSDLKEELDLIESHLSDIRSSNENQAVCIVLRTTSLLNQYLGGLEGRGIEARLISTDEDPGNFTLYIATMHRVKGLEFDHVILAGTLKKEYSQQLYSAILIISFFIKTSDVNSW